VKRRTVVVVLGLQCLGAAGPAAAQPAATLVAAQSEIVFTSRQMGVPVDGRFKRFEAQIALDPQRPQAGSVAIDIDTASASLGMAEADAELAAPSWFDVARFAKASFHSNGVRALGGGRFEVSGRLTIKASTRDLVVPVTVTQTAASSTATGSFVIRRLDYGVGVAEWADTAVVANDVQVRFKLVLTGLPAL
jgi:polyisoprenoid-binding protein YceI